MAHRYLLTFSAVFFLAMAADLAFNAAADRAILTNANGASFETVTGFERVLKPAWLDSLKPDLVIVGSSPVRNGFDPKLIDPAFYRRAFNYGMSSMSSYEARRFVQDSAAHASVKTLIVAADVFAGTAPLDGPVSGFDELRLKVKPDGSPTGYYGFWLFVARNLSGGGLGMHALGLYTLAQLKPGETAAERPDLFEAYGHLTAAGLAKDLKRRAGRKLGFGPFQRQQFRLAMQAACASKAETIVFFAPTQKAMIDIFRRNDTAGYDTFKAGITEEVAHANQTCPAKIKLFDFTAATAITAAPMQNGKNPYYIDLVHFRPPVGVMLLQEMLGTTPPGTLGQRVL